MAKNRQQIRQRIAVKRGVHTKNRAALAKYRRVKAQQVAVKKKEINVISSSALSSARLKSKISQIEALNREINSQPQKRRSPKRLDKIVNQFIESGFLNKKSEQKLGKYPSALKISFGVPISAANEIDEDGWMNNPFAPEDIYSYKNDIVQGLWANGLIDSDLDIDSDTMRRMFLNTLQQAGVPVDEIGLDTLRTLVGGWQQEQKNTDEYKQYRSDLARKNANIRHGNIPGTWQFDAKQKKNLELADFNLVEKHLNEQKRNYIKDQGLRAQMEFQRRQTLEYVHNEIVVVKQFIRQTSGEEQKYFRGILSNLYSKSKRLGYVDAKGRPLSHTPGQFEANIYALNKQGKSFSGLSYEYQDVSRNVKRINKYGLILAQRGGDMSNYTTTSVNPQAVRNQLRHSSTYNYQYPSGHGYKSYEDYVIKVYKKYGDALNDAAAWIKRGIKDEKSITYQVIKRYKQRRKK